MEQTNNTDIVQPNIIAPALIAKAFGPIFLDADICNRTLLDLLHNRRAHCPECKEDLTDDRQERRYYALKKFTCRKCNKRVSAKKGTILENKSMTPRMYILLSLFLDEGFSTAKICRLTGMSDESVRQWRDKLNV